MSSLNIALSVFSDTHVSVFIFNSAITSSFLLLLFSFIPRESDHVSYMTDKSSFSIYPLYAALGHLCVSEPKYINKEALNGPYNPKINHSTNE